MAVLVVEKARDRHSQNVMARKGEETQYPQAGTTLLITEWCRHSFAMDSLLVGCLALAASVAPVGLAVFATKRGLGDPIRKMPVQASLNSSYRDSW